MSGATLIWTGLGGGLALALIGAALLVREALRLNARFSRFTRQPLFGHVADVEAKFSRATGRLDEILAMIERMRKLVP